MRDPRGNNVLHLCAMHCLQEMYQHIYNTSKTLIKREIRREYSDYILKGKKDEHLKLNLFNAGLSNDSKGFTLKVQSITIPNDLETTDQLDRWIDEEAGIKMNERL